MLSSAIEVADVVVSPDYRLDGNDLSELANNCSIKRDHCKPGDPFSHPTDVVKYFWQILRT